MGFCLAQAFTGLPVQNIHKADFDGGDKTAVGNGEEAQPTVAGRRGSALERGKAKTGVGEGPPAQGGRVDEAADGCLPICCAEHQERSMPVQGQDDNGCQDTV
eukprot:1314006-Amphidinium_carterae.1